MAFVRSSDRAYALSAIAGKTIFVVFAQDSVPRRPLPPPLTNLSASSLPCFVTAALSILNSWGSSTKGIFSAVKTPCANTPLLSALNLFLSRICQFGFLEAVQSADLWSKVYEYWE